ncbi:hypothetical protein NKH36_31485 [Mesorhizobium sp. M1312]|uniref:hypothetical protein n=1 Tax=unclassified Mesorhizobium TaxID=325217 RepID=UPI003337B56C
MNIHKNARLTPWRREELALSIIEDVFPKPSRRRPHGVSKRAGLWCWSMASIWRWST